MKAKLPQRPRRGQAAAWSAALVLALALGQLHAAPAACGVSPGRDSSLPSTRFVDNGDGTVTDLGSQLMWMRCSAGQQWQGSGCIGSAGAYTWQQAQGNAERINRDGTAFFNDWRLPALRELATITDLAADLACGSARTNPAIFPGTASAPYWTATPRTGDRGAERLWTLSFGAEGLQLARADDSFHVRLVRTGP